MSVDTIGDFLTMIRNALMVSKRSVVIPFSKMRFGIATILKQEGFIRDVKKFEDDNNKAQLVIDLKYVAREAVIHEIVRVSKPSCRRYESVKKITPVIGGLGLVILSTNQGIITDKQARRLSVGGEVICHVW